MIKKSNNKLKNKKNFNWGKYKGLFIGATSLIGVVGLSLGIASPFLTKTINYYVSNKNIKLGTQKSLFFITDGGDIHDGSFNEAAYNAVMKISGSQYNYESPLDSNFSTLLHSYNLAVSRGATVLEVNGYLHEQPLKQFSYTHPNFGFILLDDQLNINNSIQQGNVASIIFKTEQVGYFAGYAAAGWAFKHHNNNPHAKNKHPLISGVGGLQIAPVTTYLAGFQQGMKKYNVDYHLQSSQSSVELYLKSLNKPAKYFGGFAPDPQNQVTSYTKQAINAGVDVIFPVGGPQAFTVIRTLKNQNVDPKHIKVIGVDQDLTNQSFAGLPAGGKWLDYILASATKGMYSSIKDLSDAIFNKKSRLDNKSISKNVFGHVYTGSYKNNWLKLTGQYKNGQSQTMNALYDSIFGQKGGSIIVELKRSVVSVMPSTEFYSPIMTGQF